MNREEMKLLRNVQGGVHMLRKAIHASDPRQELDFRCHDIWTDLEKLAALRASAAPDRMTMMVECSSGEAFPTALSPDSRKAEPVAARLNQIADNIGGSHAPELRQLAAALAPATEPGASDPSGKTE